MMIDEALQANAAQNLVSPHEQVAGNLPAPLSLPMMRAYIPMMTAGALATAGRIGFLKSWWTAR